MISKEQQRFLLWAAIGWVVVTFIALVAHRLAGPNRLNAWPSSPPFVLYSLAICGPVILFLAWQPIFSFFAALPRWHRAICWGFLALVLCGHLANCPRQTFPLMDWQMFTRSWNAETIVHYEFVATLADGTTTRLNPPRVIPSLDQGRFYVGHRAFAEVVRGEPNEELAKLHDDLFIALAEVSNKSRPTNPIVRIDVIRQTLDPRRPADPFQGEEVFRSIVIAHGGDGQ